ARPCAVPFVPRHDAPAIDGGRRGGQQRPGGGHTPMLRWIMADACTHIDALESVKGPRRRECEECVKIGAAWVHLRTCQTCGPTLCGFSSPNRHASKHARASHHPVVASAQPGERWLYCFVDDTFAEY